ncbi:MAG: hypothetical protein JEY91_11730 [Spirochaetaceae bacterium]|nr:hypothetical protein [Spirochaetaceae bacterium]
MLKKIQWFLFFVIFFVTFISCAFDIDDYSQDVKYSVTGTALTVDITIENENGGTSQYSDVAVPWEYSFTGWEGDFIYLSAQNQGSSGSVICTIYRNGGEYKSSTSSGAYVIATVSGLLP